MMLKVFFDGSCEPRNPIGIATYGYVIYDGESLIKEGKGLACEPFSYGSSNNVAEYTALIKALEYLIAVNLFSGEVNVFGDSQLAIRQMTGRYAVNAERIIPLYSRACSLAKKIPQIRFFWVPREENQVADRLSHEAYEEHLDSHPELHEKIKPFAATEKQKAYMDRLGIKYDKYISKREASRLIGRKLECK